jgi:hypothetical protein
MKNLEFFTYNKIELQSLICEIMIFNQKNEIYIYKNLIGFRNEFYSSSDKKYSSIKF